MHFVVHDAWRGMSEQELAEAGRAFVEHINGLLRLRDTSHDGIRFGGVVVLKAGGGRDYLDSATVEVRMTVSGVEEHIGPDGRPVSPPPDPLKTWLLRSWADNELADGLRVYAKADDWPALYGAYEAVRAGLGGQKAVEAALGKSTRSRFTQTANYFRHTNERLPETPMTFEEGRRFLADLFEVWLGR
jgi:hypothetical protein